MRFLSLVSLTLSALLLPASGTSAAGIRPKQIKNLVTFGDSFTSVDWSSNGGTPWPVYAAGYAGVKLHPYAKAGATCSNNLTYRPFPPLFESQLPLYFAEKANKTVTLAPHDTVYFLWIGTNDLGANALLTGSKASLVDVTNCMVDWVKVLYKSGARNFIFQNVGGLRHFQLRRQGLV
jgi:GDSL-like Lipase/Acylhydrolase